MLFSSIPFLYYFLPGVMLLYFAVPKKLKNTILFLASMFFYFWGEPKYCLLMVVSILTGYLGGIVTGKMRQTEKLGRAKAAMIVTVAILLGFLAVFKYTDFGISTVNGLVGSNIPLVKLALPIGISFYTFQILSYVVDVYRQDVEVEKNIINFGAYVVMFPQLIAGPIVRFSTVQQEMRERTIAVDKIAKGIGRFVLGLSKKVLIADLLGEFVATMDLVPKTSAFLLWMVALAYAMQIYFDFSGYSDMAIGLGHMLGFHFPENFDYPYVSKSITEFWRRWHMTLGGWFRDYVYIPLGGNRVSLFKWMRNVFVVWFLSGLWHGASWNFVLWGVYFGVILALEKLFLKKWLERLPNILQHLYAIVLVVISFVVFRLESISEAGSFLAGMFGFGLESAAALSGISLGMYQVQNYGFLIVASVIIALGIPKQLWQKITQTAWGAALEKVVAPIAYLVLTLVVTAFLIQSSVHPFLYFRF
ncbi:MAG: MBOAT family protein [Lachnospiraceae bacterium]|nr:MBOAT family protein [Lachnospiraceae bacterium]